MGIIISQSREGTCVPSIARQLFCVFGSAGENYIAGVYVSGVKPYLSFLVHEKRGFLFKKQYNKVQKGVEAMEWIERLNKAINYLEEHIKEEINYEELAQTAGCSAYHF